MTKESLQLFGDLLAQVKISPLEVDADAKWSRVTKARQEIQDALSGATQK